MSLGSLAFQAQPQDRPSLLKPGNVAESLPHGVLALSRLQPLSARLTASDASFASPLA